MSMDETLARLNQDMYHGDHRKAGICTRVEQLEDTMEQAAAREKERDKKLDRIQWGIVVVLVSVLTDVVVKGIIK